MEFPESALRRLTAPHKRALKWFFDNAGTEKKWAEIEEHDPRLVTKAKGIYKPTGMVYALSIRETLSSEYPDRDPKPVAGGGWTYQYHQEGSDPTTRDSSYANVGLMECMNDGVPVGVLRQTHGKPNVQYDILGLAFVKSWQNGYFFLESL